MPCGDCGRWGFAALDCDAPHKQAIIPLLDRLSESAAAIGAVNFIFREENALVGENTEGKGVVQAVRGSLDPAGKQVVLLGAGQLARAVALELAAAGAAGLAVVDRTPSRAEELAAMLSDKSNTPVSAVAWQEDYAVPPETELLIDAASPGDESQRLSAESLRPELFVADATANVPETRLLREARARGCKTIDGLSMLIEQAAISLQTWTGVDPNRQVMREAAEEFLGL